MKIKLKKKQNQYAQVHVDMLRNKILSLKAKGLGAVLESYSNDFELSLKSIELNSADGIKSIRSAIKELEDGYYLFRFQTRDKGGLFTTYWAFDSQKLDVIYLKEMIIELEKVELITQNDLLQRGSPHGNAVTGMPSAGCRSTASRQSTTYNNNTYQNKKDKNNISFNLQNFESFKIEIISKYKAKNLCTMSLGKNDFISVSVNEEGGLFYTNKKIEMNEIDEDYILNYLFKNPTELMKI
nr:hypothetical protein [uncultured Sulfurimonas sp.]